jgi:hypothetical protein
MERMINRRLFWILESRNLLSNAQCGFRRIRSTLDHLVNLEYYIQNAFLQRQHLVAVFLDLEKAYDTTWRYGILRPFTAGISGVDYHYFFLISSRPVISVSDLGMCYLPDILMKMECHNDQF